MERNYKLSFLCDVFVLNKKYCVVHLMWLLSHALHGGRETHEIYMRDVTSCLPFSNLFT